MIMGRPSDYQKKYCQMLIEHMGQGYSFASFAGKIKCNIDSLYEWKKKYPDFSEAHTLGLSANLLFWEGNGIYISVKNKGNFSAWRYNMANRHGWRDNQDDMGTEASPINIVIKERGKEEKND